MGILFFIFLFFLAVVCLKKETGKYLMGRSNVVPKEIVSIVAL